MDTKDFDQAYKRLNTAQKEAVEALDGPVMVIAGPGTGKTQVLALRIANILLKTDTKADGILCLTFTNSGVRAMRERLSKYIGASATKIKISTFHSFAISIVEEFFSVLDFEKSPTLLDETASVALVDEILENGSWKHLRPRGNAGLYFRDIKSLISLLKREAITPEDLLGSITADIKRLQNDPASISSRGESKGNLKKDVEKQIESLHRTEEIVAFYTQYETLKRERLLADYDDVLRYALEILLNSETARYTLRERYLYVLVDEHQDSSKVQNDILKAIWDTEEMDGITPNIFVVGDDRQLIYGFGGASLEYFEAFKTSFGRVQLITLVENYRSTQDILDAADTLLESSLTKEKLKSTMKENHKLQLVECAYPRDEIIAAAHAIKQKISEGIAPEECALLVPKNYQVKNVVELLMDAGIPVASSGIRTLFGSGDTLSCIRVLKILVNPYDNVSIGESLFDPIAGIAPLDAHAFLQNINTYKLSLNDLLQNSKPNLLSSLDPLAAWSTKLADFLEESRTRDVYQLVQYVGEHLLLDSARDHDELITRVEVVRTMLHLALLEQERCEAANKECTLKVFLDFITRLQSYHEDIPLAVFHGTAGVKVLTLHGSKGLEFDFVWVAHMDERSLMAGKRQTFALPEDIAARVEEKDEMVVRRQLYVALTRAKRFCTFSSARFSYSSAEQELAHILQELPESIFNKISYEEGEIAILARDPKEYVVANDRSQEVFSLADLADVVREEYVKTKVSVTLLNNFYECPWKWYFRSLLKLPDVLSESLIFGNVVHGTIEQILKGTTKDIDTLIPEQIHKQSVYNEILTKRMAAEAKALVSKWMKVRLPAISQDRLSERSLSVRDARFPELLLYGKIDLTENLGDGKVSVTDFKTGSVKTKSEIEKRDNEGRMGAMMRQLAMYSFLIAGTPGDVHVSHSQLEFLEAGVNNKDAIYQRAIGDEEIDLLVQDIEDYTKLLKSGEWVRRECHFKTYGKDIECPDCKRAKIYTAIEK